MRSLRLVCFVLVVMFLGCASQPSFAQNPDDPSAEFGFKPYGSFNGGSIDSVNLLNLSLNVHVPLVSYPQRGGKLNLGFSIIYTQPTLSYIYDGPNCTSDPRTCYQDWSMNQGGISIVLDNFPGLPNIKPGIVSFGMSDGSTHQTGILSSDTTAISNDASAYRVSWKPGTCSPPSEYVYSPTVTDNIGNSYSFNACTQFTSVEDTNGNKITASYVSTSNGITETLTDALGRQIVLFTESPATGSTNPQVTTDLSGCTGSLPMSAAILWSLPGPNGGNETYKVCIAEVTINLQGCQNANNPPLTKRCIFEPGGSRVQSIVLPNKTTWTFAYDSSNSPSQYAYGDLTQITFPTGGTISYVWSDLPDALPCQDTSLLFMRRGVQSRTVNANDGQGGHLSTYTQSVGTGTEPPVQTTVVDPMGNQSIHAITSMASTCSYYETQAQYFYGNASGANLLKTITTQYNANPIVSLNTAINVVPTSITTTWPNGQVSQMQKDYAFDVPISGSPSLTYGNVTALREYDYGNGAPGALLRQTTTAYKYQSSSAYQTNNLVTLPATVTVKDGSGNQNAQTTFGYDESSPASSGITTQHDSAPPAGTARGNQTSKHRWLNTTGTTINSSATHFDTGETQTATDPKGNPTTFAYSAIYVGAYPTTVTNALNQITTKTYDFNSGLLASTTDPNKQTTTYSYDSLTWRPTQTKYPDQGLTTVCYSDIPSTSCSASGPPYSEVVTQAITSTVNKITTAVFDGLGRTAQTQLNSAPLITTVTTYDGDGRVSTVSNPYFTTSDPTYGITSYQYDGLGRTLSVTEPDGSSPSNVYSGSCVTATDEQGKNRQSCTDGLGRLTTVVENPGGLGYQTTYTYDVLDDLTSIVQNGSRQRTITYNSLAQVTQAVNPESGTISYAYDPDGNLISKTAPAPNQAGSTTVSLSYCYDALNRMTGKAYIAQSCPLNSPVATYSYDQSSANGMTITNGIGRRTSMTDPAGSEAWSYDSMGRVLADQRTTNSITKSIGYTYSPYLIGSVANITYPSGLSLTYTYDGVGRPLSAADQNGVKYANAATYAPQGALQAATIAATSNFSGFAISNSYNQRLRPNERKVSSSAGTAIDLSYCFYALSGGSCPSTGTTNNGNVMAIANNLDTTRSQVFSYDALNRISTGASLNTSGTNCWGEQYGYDAWGNLLTVVKPSAYSACALPDNVSVTVSAKNQITTNGTANYTYDSAGNVDTISGTGGASYVYNSENQLTSTAGVTYTYDGYGKRAEKSAGPLYWYGMSGEVLEEVLVNGVVQNDYVYFSGGRIAKRDASGDIFAYFSDHLGSSRKVEEIVAGASTATLTYDADFYPFGAEHAFVDSANPTYKFTGKERDSESNLDNFGARYGFSSMGRFMSADWADETDPVPYADEEDPQTLNLYAYVRNNPLSKRDADGHHQVCADTTYSIDENGNLVVHANCYEVPDALLATKCAFGFCSAADQAKLNAQTASYEDALSRGLVQIYATTLPIGPGDLEALGGLENLLQDLKNGLQPTAESPALQKIIDQLFRTTDKLPGGTAGAVRQELETGEAVGDAFHSIKAAERAAQLEKLVNTGTLSTNDTNLARAIVQDLRNALAGK
jgi:RHS repeat-associated protein